MILFIRRVVTDLLANKILNTLTIITIALSVLIVSAFLLFIFNANLTIEKWSKGLNMMVYLEENVFGEDIREVGEKLSKMPGVVDFRFISKDEALNALKMQMKRQDALFKGLQDNPLPDAFEVSVRHTFSDMNRIEILAGKIERLPKVEEVEYGKKWLGQFSDMVNLLRLGAYGLGGLFFLAAVFFVANTIRLVLYSRRDEIEILRLVGARESFIKDPFYLQSLILGGLGGGLGLVSLYGIYRYVVLNLGFVGDFSIVRLTFLPAEYIAYLLLGSMVVGWLGCFLSLKQFLKN